MAYFNLPFSVRISNDNPVDGDRYLVLDDTARDALITNGRAYEGLLIYHQASGALYYLNKLGETPAESEWYPVISSGGASDHGALTGLGDDDHPQYVLVDGSRGFSAAVSGVDPTISGHLATKGYVDSSDIAYSGAINSWVQANYYERSEFMSSAGGEPTQDVPVKTNYSGWVHNSLLEPNLVLTHGTRGFTAAVSGRYPTQTYHLATFQAAIDAAYDYGYDPLVSDYQYSWHYNGMSHDDHPQYVTVSGTRGFLAPVSGRYPTQLYHLATADYAQTAAEDWVQDHTSNSDPHMQYSLVNGSRKFTAEVSGVTPIGVSGLTTKIYVDGRFTTLSGWADDAFYLKSEFVSSGTNRELAKNAPLLMNGDGYVDGSLISGFASSGHTHSQYVLLDSSPIITGRIRASGLTVVAPSGYIRIYPPVSDLNVPVSLDLFENGTDFGYGGYGFRLDYNPSSNLFELWSSANTTTNRWLYMHRDTGELTTTRKIITSGLTVGVETSGVIRAYSTSLTSPVAGALDLMKGTTGEFGAAGNYGFRWVYNGSNNNLELWSYYSEQEPDLRFTMNRDTGLARFPAYISGLTPLQPYHVTRKDYVDGGLSTLSGWVDGAFYEKSEFIDTWDGTGFDPIKTNTSGYIDKKFITWSEVSHGDLANLTLDDHTQYILVDGTRGFTGVVSGITPINPAHLSTKGYIDSQISAVQSWATSEFYTTKSFTYKGGFGNENRPLLLDADGYLDYTVFDLSEIVNFSPYIDHHQLAGLSSDDHTMYMRTNASRKFTAEVSGVTPVGVSGLTTKTYVDTADALRLPLAGGTMTGDINMSDQNIYFTLKDLGSITNTTQNIDWTSGHKQKLTINGANIITFSDPPGACNVLLIVVQGSASATIASWPTIKWANSTAPTLSTVSGATDIISFLFDGTDYYGMGSLNFG